MPLIALFNVTAAINRNVIAAAQRTEISALKIKGSAVEPTLYKHRQQILWQCLKLRSRPEKYINLVYALC